MDAKDYNERELDYIWGEMSKEEEALFKEELKPYPEVAKDLELQKRIIDQVKIKKQLDGILNAPGIEEAKIEAEKAIKEHDMRKRREYLLSIKSRRKYIYPIAATLLALLFIGNLTFFIVSPDLAFQKFCKEYTPVYYAQANINEAQALLVHSFEEYNKGNYEAVAENMHTLMENGELNVRGQIVLAFYDAWNLSVTDKIKSSKTKQEDALWYLALTTMKLNDLEKAQALFKELSTTDYRRANKAARMERKISKILLAE